MIPSLETDGRHQSPAWTLGSGLAPGVSALEFAGRSSLTLPPPSTGSSGNFISSRFSFSSQILNSLVFHHAASGSFLSLVALSSKKRKKTLSMSKIWFSTPGPHIPAVAFMVIPWQEGKNPGFCLSPTAAGQKEHGMGSWGAPGSGSL